MSSRHLPHMPVALGSVIFALVLVVFPWEVVRNGEFADLENYARRIDQLAAFGPSYFNWENSPLGWFQFEILWFGLLVVTAQLGLQPDTFFIAITAVSAFLTHRFLRPYLGGLLAAIVLLNPITIDLLSSQIRSAFAFALFLALVTWKPTGLLRPVQALGLLVLPLVHSALVMVLAIYAVAWGLARLRSLSPATRMLLALAFSALLCALLMTVLPSVLEATADRRALSDYGTKSLTYLLFWLLCGGALAISYSRTVCERWEYFFAVIICVMGPLVEAVGLPGFRFVALAIPVIFAAIPFLHGAMRHAMVGASALYMPLLYFYWVQ